MVPAIFPFTQFIENSVFIRHPSLKRCRVDILVGSIKSRGDMKIVQKSIGGEKVVLMRKILISLNPKRLNQKFS